MKTLIASTGRPRLAIAAILGCVALGCTAACIAGNDGAVPHAVVKFGDLDLTHPQGAAALYRRIVIAAYEVCKSFDIDIHNLEYPAAQIACVHKAVARAVVKVGHPALFEIYNARNHDPLPIIVAADRNP
jgi:UrcA family protein